MSARKRSSGRSLESAVGDALRKRIADNLGIVIDEDRETAIETTARIKESPAMKKHTCPGCGGKRTYTRTVPNVRKYGGVEYVSSIQPTKTLVFQCAICGGSGRVDCETCGDTGYVEEGTTEPEGLYPCDCAAGRREMAAETVTTRAQGH